MLQLIGNERHRRFRLEKQMITELDLKNIAYYKLVLSDLSERIETLKGLEHGLPSLGYSRQKGIGKQVAKTCQKLCERQKEIEYKLDVIDNALQLLPPKEKQIAKLRYCDSLPWEQIENKTFYSDKHCMRIKNRMLESLTKFNAALPGCPDELN